MIQTFVFCVHFLIYIFFIVFYFILLCTTYLNNTYKTYRSTAEQGTANAHQHHTLNPSEVYTNHPLHYQQHSTSAYWRSLSKDNTKAIWPNNLIAKTQFPSYRKPQKQRQTMFNHQSIPETTRVKMKLKILLTCAFSHTQHTETHLKVF